MSEHKYTNSLINESSPYLLQHAHNPVNWYAWNDETLEKAKQEDKLILISVGYSACHWCHVMEHQSFEDETVAKIMNDYFICIKVDREERPDIDQVYMLAVQLMTGQGGWPLNCFALPDGRPIYGGTYFPKNQWINVLLNLSDLYKNEREKAIDYAKQLTEGVRLAELVKTPKDDALTEDTIHECIKNWKLRFDNTDGGPQKAPKFPLPNNYEFLLQYSTLFNDKEVEDHVHLTLKKMAYGGIYDQIGGGFVRYSVDHYWKVPHFEKMLYDNAQLVSLYSRAFQKTKDPLYKQIVYETIDFVKRELTSSEGAFYSALDADSEGEEGKYYVWKKEELKHILKEQFQIFADVYNVNELGLWEHGNYILLRNKDLETIASKYHMKEEELSRQLDENKKTLLSIRENRIKPGLDDKTLTSWNALMSKGLLDAYQVFGESNFLDMVEKNIEFLLSKQLQANGGLYHSYKNGRSSINGFLEDHCYLIEALISMYQSTGTEKYLLIADQQMHYCLTHFKDVNSSMFFFTSDLDKALITRKMELSDNVIPASNSSIAKSLFVLGHYFENESYLQLSKGMLSCILDDIQGYGSGYSNWGILLLWNIKPFYEVAIVGKSVNEKIRTFQNHYLPNLIFAYSESESTLALLKNRWVNNETYIYVCKEKACLLPVKETGEALKQLVF